MTATARFVRRLLLATLVGAVLLPAIPAAPALGRVSQPPPRGRRAQGLHLQHLRDDHGQEGHHPRLARDGHRVRAAGPSPRTGCTCASPPARCLDGGSTRTPSPTCRRPWSRPPTPRRRSVTLGVARYELYTFDAAGLMTAAKSRRIWTATTIHVDRAAVIRGRPYMRVAGGAWGGWWVPGKATAPVAITCSAGSPPLVRPPGSSRTSPGPRRPGRSPSPSTWAGASRPRSTSSGSLSWSGSARRSSRPAPRPRRRPGGRSSPRSRPIPSCSSWATTR